MYNLVVGNHTTLNGIIEQLIIFLRVFRKLGMRVKVNGRIVPNATNILIEDFNSSLVTEMKRIKKEHPNTKYILYATEYLTHVRNDGWGTLNVFSTPQGMVRKIYNMHYDLVGDKLSNFLGLGLSQKLRTLALSINPILNSVSRTVDLTHGIEVLMAKREKNLNALVGSFDLVLANSAEVLKNYDHFLGCHSALLPTFIDQDRALQHRKLSIKYPSILFSGRQTPYRTQVLRRLGQALENPYPMPGGHAAWRPGSQLTDTTDKIKLLNQAFSFSTSNLSFMELPPLTLCDTNIYTYLKSDKTAAFEIYVPQNRQWEYSSPNRTLLSIESGFIPVDYGYFADHDINDVALSVTSSDQLSALLSQDLGKLYIELDQRIKSHNALQDAQTSDLVSKLKLI